MERSTLREAALAVVTGILIGSSIEPAFRFLKDIAKELSTQSPIPEATLYHPCGTSTYVVDSGELSLVVNSDGHLCSVIDRRKP